MTAARFRFRPRFRVLAAGSIGAGLVAAGAGLFAPGALATTLVVAGMGAAGLGGLYLGSPAWRIEVLIDDDALEVRASGDRRFRLPWAEVVKVVVSRSTSTCFVDGGEPARSLLVPGDGAPAPYDIEDRAALVAAILAHVPRDRVREVATLEDAAPGHAR